MTAGQIDPRDVRQAAKEAAVRDSERDSNQSLVDDLAGLLNEEEGER